MGEPSLTAETNAAKGGIVKRLLITTVVGGLVGAGAWLAPSLAANDCPPTDTDPTDNSISVQTPVGGACAEGDPATQTGHLWLDGEDTNPGPLSGFISASNDGQGPQGICADDNGGPGSGSASPTCVNP